MKKVITTLFIFLATIILAKVDGPYITWENNKAKVQYRKNHEIIERTFTAEDTLKFTGFCADESKKYIIPRFFSESKSFYKTDEKIAFVSDIHGQNESFKKLLINAGIINEKENWIFKDNTLCIIGDVADRGSEVTEAFWLIYSLEQQAREAGGQVLLTLGNHEIMILRGDERYVHDEYKLTTELFNTSIDSLYGENTFLGNWLRSKQVVIKLNDLLVCHGGISKEIIENNLSIDEINKSYQTYWNDNKMTKNLELLLYSKGPVWYRGYWYEKNHAKSISKEDVQKVLAFYGVGKIIVGHTTFAEITQMEHKSIIGVDTGLKYGDQGEILILEDGKFYSISLENKKIELNL